MCSQTDTVQTVKLAAYQYKSWLHVLCKIIAAYCNSQSTENTQISDINNVLVQNFNQFLID